MPHAIMLAGVAVLVFAACGEDDANEPPPTTAAETATATPTPAPLPTPPALGELRPEWNVIAEPASSLSEPYDHYAASDFVGVIRIDQVTNVIFDTFHSELTGMDIPSGQTEIQATVLKPIKGQRDGSITFVQSVVFLSNLPGDEPVVGVPAAQPPIEVAREYLVFVLDGRLLFGGMFAVHGARVWDVGFWTDAESRTYPAGLSGVEVDDLSAEVVAAAHVGLPDPPPPPHSLWINKSGEFDVFEYDDRNLSVEEKAADPLVNPRWAPFAECMATQGWDVISDDRNGFRQHDIDELVVRLNREYPDRPANRTISSAADTSGLAADFLSCADEWLNLDIDQLEERLAR